jgi:nucleotide-binding universal stress UspA family protein
MFQSVLVPTDLTDQSTPALDVARKLALEDGAHVTVLHVIETLEIPSEELEDFYQELERKAAGHLERQARQLADAGVKALGRVVVYGHRAEEVVKYAEANGIDLIVLSSHRVDPDNPGLNWATLSYKVAILAQCPVLLVK